MERRIEYNPNSAIQIRTERQKLKRENQNKQQHDNSPPDTFC